MSKEDLIPVTKGSAEARIYGMMGGRSKSLAKNEAQKWRYVRERIKSGKLKTDDGDWLIERCENSKAFKAELLAYLDEIKKDVHPNQRISLAKTYIDLDKQVHGEYIREDIQNLNVNIGIEEYQKRVMEGRTRRGGSQ